MKVAIILTLVLVGFGTAKTLFVSDEICGVTQSSTSKQQFVAGFKSSVGSCKIVSF